jgi:hypothetical protein
MNRQIDELGGSPGSIDDVWRLRTPSSGEKSARTP